jgi:hypothetical protein
MSEAATLLDELDAAIWDTPMRGENAVDAVLELRASSRRAFAGLVVKVLGEITCDGDNRVPCAGPVREDQAKWRRCSRCRALAAWKELTQ